MSNRSQNRHLVIARDEGGGGESADEAAVPDEAGAGKNNRPWIAGIGRPVVENVVNTRADDTADGAPDDDRIGEIGRDATAAAFERQQVVAGDEAQRHHQTVAVNGDRPEVK